MQLNPPPPKKYKVCGAEITGQNTTCYKKYFHLTFKLYFRPTYEQ